MFNFVSYVCHTYLCRDAERQFVTIFFHCRSSYDIILCCIKRILIICLFTHLVEQQREFVTIVALKTKC